MEYQENVDAQYNELVRNVSKVLNIDKVNAVFKQKGVHKIDFSDILEGYVTFQPSYDSHLFDNLNREEWRSFSEVIDFSECDTLDKYKALMNKLTKNYPQLRGVNIEEVYNKVCDELDRINEEEPIITSDDRTVRYPYLNWTPRYGGIISPKLSNGAAFRKWAIKNELSYYVNESMKVMTAREEARYAANYENEDQDIYGE